MMRKKPMLAYPVSDKPINYEDKVFMQPKLDGVRCVIQYDKHINKSDIAWNVAYNDLELTEEEEALGEAAKLMTLMNMFKEDEAYEKCAIIKGRMDEVNRILKKGNI